MSSSNDMNYLHLERVFSGSVYNSSENAGYERVSLSHVTLRDGFSLLDRERYFTCLFRIMFANTMAKHDATIGSVTSLTEATFTAYCQSQMTNGLFFNSREVDLPQTMFWNAGKSLLRIMRGVLLLLRVPWQPTFWWERSRPRG
jgi:hypothetical protein